LLRLSEPVAPEFNLVLSLWFAARRKTNNPGLDFEGIYQTRLFGDSPLQYNLREGSLFSQEKVKLFRKIIQGWIIQEGNSPSRDSRKITSYQIALRQISTYAQLRGLDLSGGIKKRSKTSNRGKFNTEQAKVYNVILGLGRHLGFDPGFFSPIEDQMFDMNQDVKDQFKDLGLKLYIFIRHHFRNNPDRASIKILDQFLIDTRTHSYWEKLINEDDALVCSQVLETLIKYNNDVIEADIRREFGKFGSQYTWLAENWINNRDFQENLDKFNYRKNDIKTLPLDKFIKEHYPKAYAKFYNTILKETRVRVTEIIKSLHPNVDVSDLVNLGKNDDHIGPFTWVFTEIMRTFNYPVYY